MEKIRDILLFKIDTLNEDDQKVLKKLISNRKNGEMFAGYRRVELFDEQLDITFPMFVMYPTSTLEKSENIGPYHLNVPSNAEPLEGVFRLV